MSAVSMASTVVSVHNNLITFAAQQPISNKSTVSYPVKHICISPKPRYTTNPTF